MKVNNKSNVKTSVLHISVAAHKAAGLRQERTLAMLRRKRRRFASKEFITLISQTAPNPRPACQSPTSPPASLSPTPRLLIHLICQRRAGTLALVPSLWVSNF